jgi:hypothetical protein
LRHSGISDGADLVGGLAEHCASPCDPPGITRMVAVALAAPPDSGNFDDGTADLTRMAGWLNANLEAPPAGQCSL